MTSKLTSNDEYQMPTNANAQPAKIKTTTNDTSITVVASKSVSSSSTSKGDAETGNLDDNLDSPPPKSSIVFTNSAMKKKLASEAIRNAERNFKCPLTLTIMSYPVMADDGHTYELKAIAEHLKTKSVSPLDNITTISADTLRLNMNLKNQIEEFVASEDCPAEMKEEYNLAKNASSMIEAKKASDTIKAEKLCKEGKVSEAANLGYPQAMAKMAENYLVGMGGFVKDYAKGFELATRAAIAGDELGIYILGRCYQEGCGVEKDFAAALNWFERCKDKYPAKSSTKIGELYYSGGYGVPQDYKKALELYRKAIGLGCELAACNLGLMYYDGEGLEQSFVKARKLFKKAADSNDGEAQYYLGRMMINGIGGGENFTEGFALIDKASKQGHKEAVEYFVQMALMSFADGIGLIDKLAKGGNLVARKCINKLKDAGKDISLGRSGAGGDEERIDNF